MMVSKLECRLQLAKIYEKNNHSLPGKVQKLVANADVSMVFPLKYTLQVQISVWASSMIHHIHKFISFVATCTHQSLLFLGLLVLVL